MIYFEVGEPYNSESSQFILPIGEKNKQPTIDSLKELYKSDWKNYFISSDNIKKYMEKHPKQKLYKTELFDIYFNDLTENEKNELINMSIL